MTGACCGLWGALWFLNNAARKVFLFLSMIALWYLSIGSFLWRVGPLKLADLFAVLAFVVCILSLWYLDQQSTRDAFGDKNPTLSALQWIGLGQGNVPNFKADFTIRVKLNANGKVTAFVLNAAQPANRNGKPIVLPSPHEHP